MPGGAPALVLAALFVAAGGAAAAQEAPPDSARPVRHFELFPGGRTFPVPLAAPREAGLRGALLLADRPDLADGYPGTNLEAVAAVGHRIPVARLRRETTEGPGLRLEFEVGTFSRFFLGSPQRDLINTDYRVGASLVGTGGRWEARLALLHVSSHLGDDYLAKFSPPPRTISREGLSLLVARRLGAGVRVYGSGELNLHRNPGVERTALAAGVERDRRVERASRADGPGHGPDPAVWPFAGVDLRITDATDRIAAAFVAGAGIAVDGITLRLEGRGGFGPSAMGQFRSTDERYWGIGLRIEP